MPTDPLVDEQQLRIALRDFGRTVPEAKWYIEKVYLTGRGQKGKHERDLKSYPILSMLGVIEPKEIRARIGYYRPGWTPKEAIEKGLIVLLDGSKLINQRNTQHYLFTQAYSLIMQEINKRQPGDPNDKPVALVMDEVYSLLAIPGMAEEIGMLSPLYRSRKLELYIVLQALSQLAPNLRRQIWSIGNIISFAISNFDEAYDLAQQLFKYEGDTIRRAAPTSSSHPILEQDRGQYLKIANQIQRMKHRECIVRRYMSEKQLDRYVRYVAQTKEISNVQPEEQVYDIKERLLKERRVRVKDSLEIINKRKLTLAPNKGKPKQV